MGIQSTTNLSRGDAEMRLLNKKLSSQELIRKIRAEIILMTDKEIEDELEEEYDNYQILSFK